MSLGATGWFVMNFMWRTTYISLKRAVRALRQQAAVHTFSLCHVAQ